MRNYENGNEIGRKEEKSKKERRNEQGQNEAKGEESSGQNSASQKTVENGGRKSRDKKNSFECANKKKAQ